MQSLTSGFQPLSGLLGSFTPVVGLFKFIARGGKISPDQYPDRRRLSHYRNDGRQNENRNRIGYSREPARLPGSSRRPATCRPRHRVSWRRFGVRRDARSRDYRSGSLPRLARRPREYRRNAFVSGKSGYICSHSTEARATSSYIARHDSSDARKHRRRTPAMA